MPRPRFSVFWRDRAGILTSRSELYTREMTTGGDQRLKILAGLQQESVQQAGCGSIEQVSAAAMPAEPKADPVVDTKIGKPIRLVREFWTATQCGHTMRYLLVMRFPETEGASFVMLPLAPPKPPSR